jgi:outer membrane protein assembly factor BamB
MTRYAAIAALVVLVCISWPDSLAVPISSGSNDRPVTASSPAPAPWPTYMFNGERDGANHLEHAITLANVRKLQPIWTLANNGSDFSAPIVVNGTVYYGSWNGNETAVNATTGTVRWVKFLGTDPACGGYDPMGISSTPAYQDGTLYLGGGNGYWYALNASTGATEWRYLVGTGANGSYDWASALVFGSSLYIGISSCFDNPLIPAGLIELNLTAPHTPSHVFHSSPTGLTGESIWTSPAVDAKNNSIFVTTGNENPPGYPIYANAVIDLNATTLNVTGSWQVPNVAGEDSDFGSTPVLYHTSTGVPMVLASNKNGVAYALDRSNATRSGAWGPTWNLTTGGGFSGAAFDGQDLYLAGGGSIYSVNPANGSVLWTAGMDGGGPVLGSLSWANGMVFAAGGSEVEAIDAANGTVLWNATFPDGESGVTEPVVADGRLFVASGNYGTSGHLTAFGLPESHLYPVTFSEKGLPKGTSWSVTAGASTIDTTNASLTFHEPNGSLLYVADPVDPYLALVNGSGAVVVDGLPIAVSLAYNFTSSISISETGLPSGDPFIVTLFSGPGARLERNITGSGPTITFREPNGTFGFMVRPPNGYTVTPARVLFGVTGRDLDFSVAMTRNPTPAPGWSEADYVLLAAGIAAALAALILGWKARRRPPPPRNPSPPATPGKDSYGFSTPGPPPR